MPILNIVNSTTGLASVQPSFVYIYTSDTEATVVTTGYLNGAVREGWAFNNTMMAVVYTTDDGPGLYQVSVSAGNTSLVAFLAAGNVQLPVVANHIATFDGTSGKIGDQAVTAIQKGSIQAGLSGTGGTLISFPATAANGSLIVAAVANVGNKTTTISSIAGLGQNEVITIPDAGVATSSFILADSGGTQTIATGSLALTVGTLTLGSSNHASSLTIYPPTASRGFFEILPIAASGAFNTVISNSALGQTTTYTLPDPANAAARFLVAATATPFVSGNIPQASGTGGLMVDSGVSFASLAPVTVSVTMNTASVVGAYATPVQIVAGQAGKAIMILAAQIITEVSTPFATGGVGVIQWGNSAHGAGTLAVDATTPAAEITAAASQIYTQYGLATTTVTATAGVTGLGVFFSNQTGAYTNGTGSTVTIVVQYMVVPAV